MSCIVTEKALEELQPTNILPQTPFWGRVKDEQGFDPLGFALDLPQELLSETPPVRESLTNDLLVLTRPLDDAHSYAYVPYGPTLEPSFENQGVLLEEVSEVLKEKLPKSCAFIRFDLSWENQWAAEEDYYDEAGNWLGPPQDQVQEFRLNYKTNHWNLRKSPGDLLPKNTFFLNLKQDEAALLKGMRYNTRYNIRQAQKHGVRVQEYGADQLSVWYHLYRETALRSGMPLQNEAYFASILDKQDDDSTGVSIKLLMADHEGEFLAAMFLVLSEKRATYLYGASSSQHKNLRASYLLQWESIKRAKAFGCTEYDMFGSAPNLDRAHPLHGVHLYKKGFGGELVHRMGCWDYPLQDDPYQQFRLHELQQ